MTYQCPYCDYMNVLKAGENTNSGDVRFIASKSGKTRLVVTHYVCGNKKCNNLTVLANLQEYEHLHGSTVTIKKRLKHWNLLPGSSSRPQPDYIPDAIVQDYNEACAIVDLSPKASATLSRRCLQGMIRDFHGITKDRLIDEINALKDRIDPEEWRAIDAVRKIGNIGAHMEKDINTIIDVDPKEATLLISLIEQLIHEWYVVRHNKQERMRQLTEAAEAKDVLKKVPKKTVTQIERDHQ